MAKPNALIIEDDKFIADIFSAALEEAGYDTTTVYEGNTALSMLEEISPEVITLDLHLPTTPGKDILKYIRESEHLKDTKVIIVTADSAQASYLNEQADLVLVKPVGFHQLRELANRLNPKK